MEGRYPTLLTLLGNWLHFRSASCTGEGWSMDPAMDHCPKDTVLKELLGKPLVSSKCAKPD